MVPQPLPQSGRREWLSGPTFCDDKSVFAPFGKLYEQICSVEKRLQAKWKVAQGSVHHDGS